MNASDLAWLQTPAASEPLHEARAALDAGATELQVLDRLRRGLEPEQARTVLALLDGRRAARSKFADADDLFFDRTAAEQATPEIVSTHIARRFADATHIADLGCGAGADSLALARHAPVVAVDVDPVRLAMLQANAAMRNLDDRIETAHAAIEEYALPALVDAVWLDPGRRDDRGRVLDPGRWTPPLAIAIERARQVDRAGIKVAPGIDREQVPQDAEIEFISLHGTLVVAVSWFGAAVTAERRATVLPQDASLTDADPPHDVAIDAPGRYLYDPDPGVGRAQLVDRLAYRLDAWQVDPTVAYLCSDAARETPFARRFRVARWLPFSERALLGALRDLDARRVDVMRRGSPIDTNLLERRLNRALEGSRALVVALTRHAGRPIAILCEREP